MGIFKDNIESKSGTGDDNNVFMTEVLREIKESNRATRELVTTVKQNSEDIIEVKKEQERQAQILATEVKITDAAQLELIDNAGRLIGILCTRNTLSKPEWQARIRPIIYWEVHHACRVSKNAQIAREDTAKALAICNPDDDNVITKFENNRRFRLCLFEARLNNGKKMKLQGEEKKIFETVFDHHCEEGNETTVSFEKVKQECNDLKGKI